MLAYAIEVNGWCKSEQCQVLQSRGNYYEALKEEAITDYKFSGAL